MFPLAIAGEAGTASIARAAKARANVPVRAVCPTGSKPFESRDTSFLGPLSLGNRLCVPQHSLRKATACR